MHYGIGCSKKSMIEEMAVAEVGLLTFSAKFVINLVMKLRFAIVTMKKTMILHSP